MNAAAAMFPELRQFAMVIVDSILNIIAVLLWFHWYSSRFDPLAGSTPRTLAGTLRRAEKRHVNHWQTLASLAGLLLFRTWLYWQLGSAVDWIARVDLAWVALVFRFDHLPLALLYVAVSFAKALALVYFWLIALAVIDWPLEADPLQRMIRLLIGPLARLPRWLLAIAPCLIVTFAWICLNPLLVKFGLLKQASTFGLLITQGLLLGASLYLSLKYLLPIILLACLVVNYVYLGRSPLWDFIINTSSNILRPFRVLPHQFGKVDLLPVIATVLILLVLEVLPNYLAHRRPDMRHWLWPA